MNIEKVYCIELNRILDIYEAKNEYFKQKKEVRKKFTFFCSDEKCREINKTKVIGVVYDRHQDDKVKVPPHFRMKDEHIETCEWVEREKAIDELEKENNHTNVQRKKTNHGLKRTDIIEVFNINQYQNKENEKNKKDKIKTEEDLVKEKFTSSRERIEEYKRIYSNQRISTNYLHKLVSCYHLLEERKLLENVDLLINKVIMKYRDWFKHIRYYNEKYIDRIFYGGATVSKFDHGYTIFFLDKNITKNEKYDSRQLSLYISNTMLKEYKHNEFLIDIMNESIEGRRWIKCFFIGQIILSENKARLKAVINDLNHLHIMFK